MISDPAARCHRSIAQFAVVLRVDNTLLALQQLAVAQPLQICVIGITGSVGKSAPRS
jgi:UDP-N-acetylmuramyl pentapeptide synthase